MKKKIVTLCLVVALAATAIIGTTLAYFTDRFDASATATAGTLDLSLVNNKITVSSPTSYRPGTGATIAFTLQNTGNKSVDVKETLVITAAGKTISNQFALYNASDVTLTDGVVAVKSGKTALSTTIESGKLVYRASEFILDGTGTGAETETATGAVKASSQSRSYVLVFTTSADNSWQGVNLTLDYEAQGKQHRNTNANTWSSIQTTTSFAGLNGHKSVAAK